MENLKMIDLANRNFKNPMSGVIADLMLSTINDMNKAKLSKARAKSISQNLRDSADAIAKLEAKA